MGLRGRKPLVEILGRVQGDREVTGDLRPLPGHRAAGVLLQIEDIGADEVQEAGQRGGPLVPMSQHVPRSINSQFDHSERFTDEQVPVMSTGPPVGYDEGEIDPLCDERPLPPTSMWITTAVMDPQNPHPNSRPRTDPVNPHTDDVIR
jgi:hypothetical protein